MVRAASSTASSVPPEDHPPSWPLDAERKHSNVKTDACAWCLVLLTMALSKASVAQLVLYDDFNLKTY